MIKRKGPRKYSRRPEKQNIRESEEQKEIESEIDRKGKKETKVQR